MRNISDYRILLATSSSDLEDQVCKFITDGWELYGPTRCVAWSTSVVWYQSMVMVKDKED